MPKSRNRKPNRRHKKKDEVFVPQKLSSLGRFMLIGEVQTLIHSFFFILLGMYLMEQTDKISLRTKLTIDAIEFFIVNSIGINSWLILKAHKRKKYLKWLELRQALNFIGGLILLWLTNYICLRLVKYPEDLEYTLAVKFPDLSSKAISLLSKVSTFLTSGTMALVTGVILNIFSNYLYDKIKKKDD